MSDQRPEEPTPGADPEPSRERPQPRTYRAQRAERAEEARRAELAASGASAEDAEAAEAAEDAEDADPGDGDGEPNDDGSRSGHVEAASDAGAPRPPEPPVEPAPPSPSRPPDEEEGPRRSRPAPEPGRGRTRPEPHTESELAAALHWPLQGLSLALADADRIARDIQERAHLGRLVLALLAVSVLFGLPYGFVLGWDSGWRVAALFLGSLAVCFPSLQVFSHFIGLRLGVLQNAALTLVVAAAGAGFTFGFFPILWFFRETVTEGDIVGVHGISRGLLWLAVGAGFLQLLRCLGELRWDWNLGSGGILRHQFLMAGWLLLLVFVTARMGRALELMP